MEHDYGEIKGCEICFKAFGLTRHRHKCKRCKLIVCADCGKSKSIIIGYKLKPATPHRVCSICRDDINAQEDVRKRFGTSWNTLSSVAIEWLNVCHALKELDFKGSNNYKKYLEDSATEHEIKPIISDLIDDISQGRADRESFNYSLTEFLYYSQQGRDRDTVRKNVENVLRAFYTRYTELGHTTLLINVATLLLCFADEETVFYLLCYIKEKLLPENFYDSVSSPLPYLGLVKEKYILKKTIINVLNSDFPRPNMKHVEVVYNKAANALLGGLMVDLANFRTQFYIWNEMFNQNSMKPLEMSIIKVFKHSKNYFEQYHSMTLYNYRIFVCRNIQPDTLRNDPLEFTDETRNQEAQSFDSTALDEILEERRIFTNSLELFRGLSQNDTHLIMDRIRRMIQEVRSVQKSNVTAIPISEADFLALFKDVEATQQLEGEDLAKVYRALDLEKEEKLSSRVLAGLIILLVSEDLASKLNDIFSLFAHDGQITSNETPQVISFLEEVLPVLNEANATYLNFQIHLYEMLEKLKSKIKKMQKITPQDFEAIMSKYPVFQLVTGERRNLGRSSSLLSYVSMTTNEEDSASEKGGPIDEQEFENILDEQVVEKIVDHEPEVQQPQERFEEKYEEKPYESKYEEQPYEQKYEEQPYEQKYEEQPYEEKYEEKPYVEEIQREAESPEQIITNEETQKKSESSESVIEQTSPESPDVYVNVAPTPEQEFINPTAESNSPKPDQTYTIGNRFGIQLIMPAPQVEERVEEQVEEQVKEVEPVQEEERIISQVTQEIPRQHHHTVHDVQVTAQEEYDPEEAERRARLAEEIVEIYEPEEQQQEEAPQPVNERLDWRHPEEERARAYIPNADEIHDVLGKSGFDKYSVTFNEEVPQAVQKQEETDYEVIKSEEETVQKYDQSAGEYTTTVKEEEAVVEETQGKVKLVEANESFLVKDTTADNTVADIETSFYNEPKIKQQINEAERKVVNRDTRSVVEKESGCKLCNMF